MYVLGGVNNGGTYQRQVAISLFDQQVDISKKNQQKSKDSYEISQNLMHEGLFHKSVYLCPRNLELRST